MSVAVPDILGSASPALGSRPEGQTQIAPPAVFWLLVVFLILEYARPPVLPLLRLQGMLVLLLPLLWLSSRDRPWSPILTLQTLYFVSGAAMIVLAYNYFSVYLASRIMYGNLAIAISLFWILGAWRYLVRTLWIWIAIMCYQAIHALIYDGRGTGGFLGDENDLALGCITAVPLAWMGFRDMRGRGRWVSGAALVLLLAAIIASFSRGGFVGLVGAFGYCVLASPNRVRTLLIGAGVTLFFFLATPSDYREEISSIQDTSGGTAEARFFLWQSAISMWKEHPLLGVGPANAIWLVGHYQAEATGSGMFSGAGYRERNWSGTVLHSLYFETLAERGLVGSGLMVFMVVLAFRSVRRVRSEYVRTPPATYAVALGGSLTGVLTAGVFLSISTYPYLWYLTAMCAALETAAPGWKGSPDEARESEASP